MPEGSDQRAVAQSDMVGFLKAAVIFVNDRNPEGAGEGLLSSFSYIISITEISIDILNARNRSFFHDGTVA